jgi:hypothetical protein
VVLPTARGLALVQSLSDTVEAHYQWMEQQLGRTQLTQLYDLLDQVVALENSAPGPMAQRFPRASADAETETLT